MPTTLAHSDRAARLYRTPRRFAFAALAALATALTAAPASANDWWTVNEGRFVVDGGGYGHGRGMSQWGSQGAALAGKSHREILDFYYPGSTPGSTDVHFNRDIRVRLDAVEIGSWFRIGSAAGGKVRVTDTATGASVELTDQPYFRMWKASDGSWIVQKTDARLVADDVMRISGRARFESSNHQLNVVFSNGSSSIYRGAIVAEPDGHRIAPVNHVAMDDYLASVVPAESPASWQLEALKAQAVAARSYAIASAAARGSRTYYDVCATTACQVYKGVSSEAARTTQAVRETSKEVRVYDGRVIRSEFSASNGGFKVGGTNFTTPGEDPFDPAGGTNSVHRWSKSVDPATLSKRWPKIGDPLYVQVLERDGQGPWGGRINKVRVVGTTGEVTATGDQLRWAVGLRSTLAKSNLMGIVDTWLDKGGRDGWLGEMASGEYGVPGGRAQDFRGGKLYWTPGHGTRYTLGGIQWIYETSGGVDVFGPPYTDEITEAGTQLQHFERGSAVWTPEHESHMLYGGIGAHYFSGGGPAVFGAPTSGEYDVSAGRAQDFVGGTISWDKSTFETRFIPSS